MPTNTPYNHYSSPGLVVLELVNETRVSDATTDACKVNNMIYFLSKSTQPYCHSARGTVPALWALIIECCMDVQSPNLPHYFRQSLEPILFPFKIDLTTSETPKSCSHAPCC